MIEISEQLKDKVVAAVIRGLRRQRQTVRPQIRHQ